MLQLREFTESDLALAEAWLHKVHVRKWYEIPQLGVTLEDWMMECKERNGKYQWITHLIVMWQEKPIGLCQYYKATDSEEDFGTLPRIGTYGIDYLIGEEDCIGKGLGKDMLKLLVNRIFSFPDAYRITADIDRENHASEKTLLSCGFTLQNPVKSRYILLKSEFIKTS